MYKDDILPENHICYFYLPFFSCVAGLKTLTNFFALQDQASMRAVIFLTAGDSICYWNRAQKREILMDMKLNTFDGSTGFFPSVIELPHHFLFVATQNTQVINADHYH